MSRRRRSTSDDLGIKDLMTFLWVAAIAAVLFAVAAAVLAIVTYWYISIPAALGVIYAWHYTHRAPKTPSPTSVTKVIVRKDTTATGTMHSKTTLTYDQGESGLSKLLHTVVANLK
jgi:hypothetical protein